MWRGATTTFSIEHIGIAERGLRFAARAVQQLGEISLLLDETHAAPAAAGYRLDHDGVADLPGFDAERSGVLLRALVAGHDGNAGLDRDVLRRGLAAQRAHGLAARADEGDAGLRARIRQIGVFREEPIAGVDRVGAGLFGGCNDLVDHQIAFGRGRAADVDRFVGFNDVQRFGIRVGIDRDGRDAHPARGADDPAGDLAAVGDQDFLEHGDLCLHLVAQKP